MWRWEEPSEEVLQSAGGHLGRTALCWTSLMRPWKSVPCLTGWKNNRALRTYAIDGRPSTGSLAVNGNDRIRYKIPDCRVSVSGESQSAPLVTTSQATSSDRGWQLGCPWLLLLPLVVSSQSWTPVSIFWNPTFIGIAESFGYCRQGYSKCLYLFVLQVLKKSNLIHASFTNSSQG